MTRDEFGEAIRELIANSGLNCRVDVRVYEPDGGRFGKMFVSTPYKPPEPADEALYGEYVEQTEPAK